MNDDDLDLSAVASDAALLDALAAGSGPDDDALAGLSSLRAALDADLGDLLTTAPRAPLQAAPVGEVVGLRRPAGRRGSRRAAAVIAGAALALGSTGVAAATYEARPGDSLYGLRAAVAGPRAEDPGVLADRLDAVQQQLQARDTAARDAARAELDEVASLLAELDPGLRADLDRRHAALTERLAASGQTPGAAGEDPMGPKAPIGPPAGPKAPVGPPVGTPRAGTPGAATPGAGGTPDSGSPATRGPQSPPKQSAPPAPPTEPQRNGGKATPQRPTPAPAEQPGRPSPRASQGGDRPDDAEPSDSSEGSGAGSGAGSGSGSGSGDRDRDGRDENGQREDPNGSRSTEPTAQVGDSVRAD